MNIAFRTDASFIIGSGHVMRCITLAQELKRAGHDIIFISRAYSDGSTHLIKFHDFPVHILPFNDQYPYSQQVISNDYQKWLWVTQEQDAYETKQILMGKNIDWLIVDHYGLDKSWHVTLRPYVNNIMVIDDLANRHHDCDLLLDANYNDSTHNPYSHLLPYYCQTLLGSDYALIRRELMDIRDRRISLGKSSLTTIRTLLIYMGGADANNMTKIIMDQLIKLANIHDYHVDVVVGMLNTHKEIIRHYCDNHPSFHYHCQPTYYPQLLINADIAIAASGASSYERCYILLPSIAFSLAENQNKTAQALDKAGVHHYIQRQSAIDFIPIFDKIKKDTLQSVIKMDEMVDGLGVKRIIGAMNHVNIKKSNFNGCRSIVSMEK